MFRKKLQQLSSVHVRTMTTTALRLKTFLIKSVKPTQSIEVVRSCDGRIFAVNECYALPLHVPNLLPKIVGVLLPAFDTQDARFPRSTKSREVEIASLV